MKTTKAQMPLFTYKFVFFVSSCGFSSFVLKIIEVVDTYLVNTHIYF
jgi:hypothetical protein